jgi:hypothetical protein
MIGVSELKECPSCDSNYLWIAYDGVNYQVQCICGFRGPRAMNGHYKWNALPRRSDLDEPCKIIEALIDHAQSAEPDTMIDLADDFETVEGEDTQRARVFLDKHKPLYTAEEARYGKEIGGEMSDDKQEERERALQDTVTRKSRQWGFTDTRDVVWVPRADYERMQMAEMARFELIPRAELEALRAENERGRRALWSLMKWSGYPAYPRGSHEFTALNIAGLAVSVGDGWTPTAHALAVEMEELEHGERIAAIDKEDDADWRFVRDDERELKGDVE